MTSPDEVERQHTLRTAVARYEELRSRELLADSAVIARKAGYGQQLAVRTARAAGASWTAIARALGMSKQAAWEAHTRWIDDQADQNRTTGHQGLDADEAARARRMAGSPGDEA